MQVNPIHGEFLGIFQKQHVCLGWTHWPGKTQIKKFFSKVCFTVWIVWRTREALHLDSYINSGEAEVLTVCVWWNMRLLKLNYLWRHVAQINAHPLWLPVCAMQLHHLFLQLFALSGGQAQILHIVRSVDLWVIFSKLWLSYVGAQQGQCDKGTGKNTTHNVLPQLETQEVSDERKK